MMDALTLKPGEARPLASRITSRDGRTMISLTGQPPRILVLNREAIARLNFQPRVCPPPQPCIASRHGDIVTIEFDSPRKRWRYQCHPLQWEGQDVIDEHRIAAVLIDDVVANTA